MASIACVATFGGRETVNTYLQGRKITAAHDYERDHQASECFTFGLRAIHFVA